LAFPFLALKGLEFNPFIILLFNFKGYLIFPINYLVLTTQPLILPISLGWTKKLWKPSNSSLLFLFGQNFFQVGLNLEGWPLNLFSPFLVLKIYLEKQISSLFFFPKISILIYLLNS